MSELYGFELRRNAIVLYFLKEISKGEKEWL